MDKSLGHPISNPDDVMSTDQVIQHLLTLQERAYALMVERRAERLPGEPTRMQNWVLQTVSRQPSLTVSELADILRVSLPTASQLVNTLVERGWLEMAVSPTDRRRHHIHVTESGQQMIDQRVKRRLVAVRRVLDQLDPKERTQLINLLDRLAQVWQSSEGSSSDEQ